MHWILQTNLFNEVEWENLVGVLERFDIPYSVHEVIPFIRELMPPAEPKQKKVICVGSYSMRHTAKANNWNPGVYDIFDKDFTVQLEHWGDMMLNADSQVMKFRDVGCISEPKFLRPINDSKHFAGRVFEPEEFNEWYRKIVVMEFDYGNDFSGDTMVQVCNPKKIYAEYRYWIIDAKIVTKSLYKRGGRVIYSPDVDSRIDRFVINVLRYGDITLTTRNNGWQPHRAYVLDVCETPDGIKIVEINTINASGFYAGSVMEIVMALEAMESRQTCVQDVLTML